MTVPRTQLLVWIIAFKAVKATVLTMLGVALLMTRDSDPAALAVRLAMTIHLPLSARLVDRATAFLSTLTVSTQSTLAVSAFAYAFLMGAEGVALYFRKPWARWFTIIATGSLIPIEIYEIWRAAHPARVIVLKQSLATLGRATGKAFKSPSNLTTSFSSEISNFTLFEEVAITLCCRTVEIATVTSTVTVGPLPTEPVLLTN